VSLLIFLITGLTAFGFLITLPISLLRICHQVIGVAINQPHGIYLVTFSYWDDFGFFHQTISGFSLLVTESHYFLSMLPCLGNALGSLLHSLLSYCISLTEASI